MSKTELAILLGQEFAKAEQEYLDAVSDAIGGTSSETFRTSGICTGINRVARAALGDNRNLWDVFHDAYDDAQDAA